MVIKNSIGEYLEWMQNDGLNVWWTHDINDAVEIDDPADDFTQLLEKRDIFFEVVDTKRDDDTGMLEEVYDV